MKFCFGRNIFIYLYRPSFFGFHVDFAMRMESFRYTLYSNFMLKIKAFIESFNFSFAHMRLLCAVNSEKGVGLASGLCFYRYLPIVLALSLLGFYFTVLSLSRALCEVCCGLMFLFTENFVSS